MPDPDLLDWSAIVNAWYRAIRFAEKSISLTPENGLADFGVKGDVANLMLVPAVRNLVAWMASVDASGGQAPIEAFASAMCIATPIDGRHLAKLSKFTKLFGYEVIPAANRSDRVENIIITRETQGDRAAIVAVGDEVTALGIIYGAGLDRTEVIRLLEWVVVGAGGGRHALRSVLAHFPNAAENHPTRLLGPLPIQSRRPVARAMCRLLAKAGVLGNPEWVACLEKAFDQAKLDRKELYSFLHTGGKGDGDRALDPVRLAAVAAATDQAATALATVFLEDGSLETSAESATDGLRAASSPIVGLDTAHAGLVAFLARRDSVTGEEMEEEARARGLMPRGAVDHINDWALDVVDDVVVTENAGEWVIDKALIGAALDKQGFQS